MAKFSRNSAHTSYLPVKIIFFFILAIFAAVGCARQTGGPAASVIDLTGSYRVLPGPYGLLWARSQPVAYSFVVKNEQGGWLRDDTQEGDRYPEIVPLRRLASIEIEGLFGQKAATGLHCLEADDGDLPMIFCAAPPGLTIKARLARSENDEYFTSQTGYFIYIYRLGLWDLEKIP